ncbi:septal ring lytic transglycosylase RlpA family protein [Acetobacter sp. AN02]|uniref:septal ring lytic transglycosylase RlpA family protein n=1 Tax=Acetobacter sp. AN02 TaxID=2894186 RepID=UPI0024344D41|nr:septal ring lytic transglycosylase RlpA family protein [Acetobacter sp. AN02]MDG6094114.1 septal ring lytic transglycosylase RlpA family protein [Acetobacter sp. AN02]
MKRVRKTGMMLFVAGASFMGRPHHAAASQMTSADSAARTSWSASVRSAMARRAKNPEDDAASVQEKGVASWYRGRPMRRQRKSAAPELTAAHPSAPMGSHLKVTSEKTGRSVVVTVNDRGPFIGGRVIDLSKAAAQKIGLVGQGVGNVTIEPVEVAAAPEEKKKN